MNYKNAITFLLFFVCALPKPLLADEGNEERADYIVIGLGTAGAAAAKLLSDDNKTSVIGIHNGRNLTQDPDIKYTKNGAFTLISALFGSSFYQTGFTVPQPHANNNRLFWTIAVPEGGASSINAGAWARGTNQVYSQWEAIAGPEWSTTVILDLYKELENYHGVTPNPSARGFNGPIDVRQVPKPTAFAKKFSKAVAKAVNVPIVVDYNNPDTPIGASPQLQCTQRGADGRLRVSGATAFLNKQVVNDDGTGVGNRKLKLNLRSTALRTVWKGNKAIGVEYFHDGKIKKAFADKGVIVCAGLYSSAFLMHSGVGPNTLLTKYGINIKHANPHVGAALADQTIINIAFATNPKDTPIVCDATTSLPGGISFNKSNTSFFFSVPNLPNASDKQRLLNAFFCDDAFPENSIFAQISWLPAPGGDPTIRKVRIATVNPIPGLALALVDLVQPLSRGRITIGSFNPFDKPIIDSGMFTNSADLELYVQTFQTYIRDINTTLHKMDKKYELIYPSMAVINDVKRLKDFIKDEVIPCQCWQSHCRMAPRKQGGVVDNRGRVYGVENLYVADNSINPVLMDGTTMATGYLIAANIVRLLQQ